MGAAAASRDMQGETADTLYLFGSWTTTPAHRQMPGRGLAVKRHAEPAPRWDTAARLRNKASARRSRTAAMLGRAGMGCGGRATLPRLQGRSNHIPQSCFLDVADSICPHNSWLLRKSSWNGSSLPGPAPASHNHSFRSSPPSVIVSRTLALPAGCCFAVVCSLGLVVDISEPVLHGIADRPNVACALKGSLGESDLA